MKKTIPRVRMNAATRQMIARAKQAAEAAEAAEAPTGVVYHVQIRATITADSAEAAARTLIRQIREGSPPTQVDVIPEWEQFTYDPPGVAAAKGEKP